jgi:uncharacterized DUF497 family protein
MEFEWDDAKSERNFRERGFGFDFAALIFERPVLQIEDRRFDYGEVRMRALGAYEGIVLLVVFTDRDDVRRIISARPANRKERVLWQLYAETLRR